MRKDVDHLPATQQGELERVQRVLMEEFAEAIGKATTPSRKNGKILKIILFGSYARTDWVDEPENGYQSDFDLLVVVNHEDLTDIAHYWYVAEDRILRDAEIGRPVNIIVHSLDDEQCPMANSQRMHELWPGSELLLVDGLGHRFIAQDSDVLQRVVDFCETY